MQSVSSRIWTRVAVSSSSDDNHYTTGTSSLIIIDIIIIRGVLFVSWLSSFEMDWASWVQILDEVVYIPQC